MLSVKPLSGEKKYAVNTIKSFPNASGRREMAEKELVSGNSTEKQREVGLDQKAGIQGPQCVVRGQPDLCPWLLGSGP